MDKEASQDEEKIALEEEIRLDRIIVSDIKNMYSWGLADKDDIINTIVSQNNITFEKAEHLHDLAMDKMIGATTDSKDAKRAKALHRLAYIQTKISSGDDFNPKILVDIERLRAVIEGTESPKEINNTIRAASIVASTIEEAEAKMAEMGFIQQRFDDEEIDKILEDAFEGELVDVDDDVAK